MKHHRRPAVLLASLLAAPALLVASGCEDDAARARAEARAAIEAAARDLPAHAATLAAGGDGVRAEDDLQPRLDRARSALDAIQRNLARLDGAEGQQAAAAALAANAARHLAEDAIRDAAAMEADHRTLRATVASALDAGQAISAYADARESGGGDPRSVIESARAERSAVVAESSTRVADLDGPIERLRTESRQATDQSTDLASRASALRREARELGWADGRETFERAVALELESGDLRFANARRESELTYDLEAEQSLARLRADLARTSIQRLDEAARALDQRERDTLADVGRSRQAVREIAGRIEEAMRELEERMDGPLDDAYAEATGRLDAADDLAGRAGADARVDRVRLAELRGRMNMLRANGLEDHAALVARLSSAVDVPTSADGSSASSLRREAAAARQAAIEALTAARDGARGGSNMTALANAAEQALAALEGRAAQAAPSRSSSSSRGAAQPAGAGGPPFATPEALLGWMQSMDTSDPANMARVIDVVHFDRPDGDRILREMKRMMTAMQEMQSAVGSRFGSQMADSMNAGMSDGFISSGGGDFQGAAIASNDGSRAALSIEDPDTGRTVEFVKVGNAWKIDGTPALAAGGMDPDGMLTMLTGMADAFSNIAEQVESGAIGTEQQLGSAMMGVMARIMEQSGQGMPQMPDGSGG